MPKRETGVSKCVYHRWNILLKRAKGFTRWKEKTTSEAKMELGVSCPSLHEQGYRNVPEEEILRISIKTKKSSMKNERI